MKRERLRAAGINEPVGMRFVSVDFECESLQEGLARMGFRVDAPAFVSWLGVTQYLTPAAIQSTLDLLGSFAPGSEVAVTYVVPDDLRDDVDHAFAAAAAALTAARGEPWLTFFHPQSSRRWFGRQGSRPSSISGQTRPPAQPYFHNRTDRLRPQGLERCVAARR